MKQYKLIKIFPGSPELGTIVETRSTFYIDASTKQSTVGTHYTDCKDNFFKENIVENFPEFWQEIKPLFTTKDGVDIYQGMTTFFNVNSLFKMQEFQVTNEKYELKFLKDGSKQFSTEEKAEEYILMHKPCLSVYEVSQQIPFSDIVDLITNNVKKLAKRKI